MPHYTPPGRLPHRPIGVPIVAVRRPCPPRARALSNITCPSTRPCPSSHLAVQNDTIADNADACIDPVGSRTNTTGMTCPFSSKPPPHHLSPHHRPFATLPLCLSRCSGTDRAVRRPVHARAPDIPITTQKHITGLNTAFEARTSALPFPSPVQSRP